MRLFFFTGLLLPIVLLLLATRHPLSLDDGLRHLTIARHYREEGMSGVGGWGDYLFTGYFTEQNSDPWFLADLAYIPFTFLPTTTFGLKLATLIFLLFFLCSFLPLLRFHPCSNVLRGTILVLLLYGSSTFLFRLLLGRPFVIVTGLFLLVYLSVLHRQYVFLLPLLAFATLFSHLFLFPLLVALVGSLWIFLRGQKRQAFLCAFSSLSGVLLGFLIHPHRRAYVQYLMDILLPNPFSKDLGLGGELHSGFGFADIPVFLMLSALFLLGVLLVCRGRLLYIAKQHPEVVFTAMLVLLFLIAFILWVRAIDFLWPLLLLLFLQVVTALPEIEREVLHVFRSRITPHGCTWRELVLVLCFLNFVGVAVPFLKDDPWKSPKEYAAIEAVRPGAKVLNVDWEVFPVLFSLNSSVLYARAMDPSFDYVSDPQGFAILDRIVDRGLWEREADGIDAAAWICDLRTHFRANYLAFMKHHHQKLLPTLRALPDLPVFAESRALVIFSL